MGKTKRSPVWDDPRVKPPYGSVAIDRGHPIGTALLFGLVMNEQAGGLYDLVSGIATPPASTAKFIQTPLGPSPSVTGTGRYGPTPTIPFGAAGTLIISATISTTAGYPYLLDTDAGSGTGWVLYSNAGGLNNMFVNGKLLLNTAIWDTANVPATFALTWTGANTQIAYKNGVQVGTSSQSVVWSPTALILGNIGGGGYGSPWPGAIHHWLVLNRPLRAAELLDQYHAPYAFLRPIIRRRYFVPSGAAAAGSSIQHRLSLLGVGS